MSTTDVIQITDDRRVRNMDANVVNILEGVHESDVGSSGKG